MLAWFDLETTGLDPLKCVVLEVACVLTDDALNEVSRFHCVTSEAGNVSWNEVDELVLDMHLWNGLLVESLVKRGHPALDHSHKHVNGQWFDHACVDQLLCDWLNAEFMSINPIIQTFQLAGSTINFDRNFLQRHLPKTHALLHYRNVDVSTLNEIAKRFWPQVYEGRPKDGDKKHRAVSDVEHSLKTAKYYTEKLGPL